MPGQCRPRRKEQYEHVGIILVPAGVGRAVDSNHALFGDINLLGNEHHASCDRLEPLWPALQGVPFHEELGRPHERRYVSRREEASLLISEVKHDQTCYFFWGHGFVSSG
jgi:hypothetical protein